MRRITLWFMSTISALVLLFSYHTSTNAKASTSVVASGTTGTTDTATGATGTTAADSAGSTSTPTPSATSGKAASTTVLGDAISTRYGPVQVQITVAGGKITLSEVTQVPWNDHKDIEINSYAVPVLNKEAVVAQSSGIDMVSGATYTSNAYIESLQSAIDKANLS